MKVVDDGENTGGCLILTAADGELTEDGADTWVGTADDVDGFFEESGWSVEWLDGHPGPVH